jgi:NitT/TauT family transport system ATP-binding protein
MSGGEQQLLLLARAILHRPSLLFLDEPFSAVDIARRHLIHDFLGHWIAAGDITLFLATHNIKEAVLLSDRVHVLVSGKIIGTVIVPLPWPRHLTQRHAPEFQVALEEVLTLLACSDE